MNARKHFEKRLVEHIGGTFQKSNLARRLDPTNGIHHLRTIDHRHPRQIAGDFAVSEHIDAAQFETDAFFGKTQIPQHVTQGEHWPLVARVINSESLDPALVPCDGFGASICHNSRVPMAWPHGEHRARRIRQVDMPRHRSWIRESRQISEIDSPARDNGGQLFMVHHAMEPFHIRNDRTGSLIHQLCACAGDPNAMASLPIPAYLLQLAADKRTGAMGLK